MIARLKTALSAAAGIICAAAVTYAYAALVMVPAARKEARMLAVAEQAAATVKAELERKGDDALLQSKSDYDLCVIGLRGNGMPIDACEQLRRLREE